MLEQYLFEQHHRVNTWAPIILAVLGIYVHKGTINSKEKQAESLVTTSILPVLHIKFQSSSASISGKISRLRFKMPCICAIAIP